MFSRLSKLSFLEKSEEEEEDDDDNIRARFGDVLDVNDDARDTPASNSASSKSFHSFVFVRSFPANCFSFSSKPVVVELVSSAFDDPEGFAVVLVVGRDASVPSVRR